MIEWRDLVLAVTEQVVLVHAARQLVWERERGLKTKQSRYYWDRCQIHHDEKCAVIVMTLVALSKTNVKKVLRYHGLQGCRGVSTVAVTAKVAPDWRLSRTAYACFL